MKIGFIDRSEATWTAGASYTRSVTSALASALSPGDELCVLSGCSGVRDLAPGVGAVRSEAERLGPKEIETMVRERGIDVVLPVTELLTRDTACARIGWIPDFQHRRLPHYYRELQRQQRDHHFQKLIDECGGMMFSSEAVRADFRELYPEFPGLSACVHFPSSLAYRSDLPSVDPAETGARYGLPAGFALVVNQFWRHKNHRTVVEAVAAARARNPAVHVVMVGMLSDSRDATNSHISEIVRRLSTERLYANLSILGEVPDDDLLALLRGATLVIQPSEFEGWSTTVQDALALGKPLACSDLAVHREQAPAAAFFGVHAPEKLADILAKWDWSRSGWAGAEAEEAALAAERERGRLWGEGLIRFCREVVAAGREGKPAVPGEFRPETLKAENIYGYAEYLESQVRRMEGVEASLREHIAALDSGLKHANDVANECRLNAEKWNRRYHQERAKPLRQHVIEAVQSTWAARTKRNAN